MSLSVQAVQNHEPKILFGLTLAAVAASYYGSYDPAVWFLDASPVLVGLPIFAIVYFRRIRLTPLLYRLLFIEVLVLLLGSHYTYARVPIGNWFQQTFNLKRNHYDRIGHFFQGFVPAILVREILLRKNVVQRGFWLSFMVICVALAFSAVYELLEWLAAVTGADKSGDFMGSQGDKFDAQWDMFLAFVGACVSLVFLSELHDYQLSKLGVRNKAA